MPGHFGAIGAACHAPRLSAALRLSTHFTWKLRRHHDLHHYCTLSFDMPRKHLTSPGRHHRFRTAHPFRARLTRPYALTAVSSLLTLIICRYTCHLYIVRYDALTHGGLPFHISLSPTLHYDLNFTSTYTVKTADVYALRCFAP